MRKNVFYIHTNTVTIKREQKNAQTIFPETHEKCELKTLGKKSSLKSAKKRFLYSHEHRDRKMGTKNTRNNFPRNTRILRAKNVGKKYRL